MGNRMKSSITREIKETDIKVDSSGLRIIPIHDDLKVIENIDRYPKEIKRLNNPERLIPNQEDPYEYFDQSGTKPKKYKSTVLAHYTNVEINVYSYKGSLLSAFIFAYNNHEDITLVPDDVWITILFHFSMYINKNSEKMRKMFVNFEGKKELVVTTHNELSENQWEEFFDLMTNKIKENTKDNIVPEMQCNFSTTNLIEKMISTATIMDSFKKFFNYGRCIPMCGIKNVRFAGTLADWESVLGKLLVLRKYDVNGQWEKYVDELEPILVQFIDTYNGKVDMSFWDKVMNLEHGRLGSGSTTKISGWILAFYGQSNKTLDIDDIKDEYIIDVPVKVDNKITNITKNVRLRATFQGINKTDGSYRPQLSMIVCELESDNIETANV